MVEYDELPRLRGRLQVVLDPVPLGVAFDKRIPAVPDDNDVKVTLSVRAKNYTNQLANASEYTATQTLTVTWAGE